MIESVNCRINSMRHAKRFSIVNCIDSNCLTVIFIALRAYRLNKLNFLKILFSKYFTSDGPQDILMARVYYLVRLYNIKYKFGTLDWFIYSFIIEASPSLSYIFREQGTSIFYTFFIRL